MTWLWWLSGPVVVTALTAVWTWVRSRPEPPPTTAEAMQAHADYLDALAYSARSKDRGIRGDETT